MFQRFHDAKTQETDIIQDNGSRSSTPGTAIDGRTMYTCNVSPMTTHDSLVSYSNEISPTQSVISENTQLICEDNQVIHNPKYVSTSPPEAHRYVVEVYRSPNDIVDSSKYIDDSVRMSIDVFRESQVDPQRVPLEMQRIPLEEHPSPDSYRRSLDSYPIDLQRVPEYALDQGCVEQQRLESELSRLQSELLRNGGADPRILQQDQIDMNGFQNTHTLDYRIVTEDCGESPPRMIQENSRGNITDSQRLVQESILKDYYNSQRHSEVLRISSDPRITSENIRYASPEDIRVHRFDIDMNSQTTILAENLRLGAETPHSIVSESVRVTPDGSSMVPENLCITDPRVMPENLHIGNDGSINGLSPNASGDAHIVTQNIAIDSPMTIRTHYDSHINNDPSHSYRETIRVQSPQYTDSYRNNMFNGNMPAAPPTPAPSVPPMSETTSTPISSRYYSGDSYISTTPHSSHSIVYSNQFNSYSNEVPEEKDFRQTVLTIEERIERGYQDIKPFDQEYPVSLPVMHLSQEPIPPPSSIAKLSKPKKPKEAKPLRNPITHNCSECHRNFKNSTQLKNHMWRHTGEKPFTCEECGSKFTQQGNLRAHRRIHTGERPYQCPDCKSCFTQLSTLKTHQKIHSDERPYKCNHCDAAFRQIANLKTHQVTHTGERPHQCDQCDKAFTQKSNLKAHKNRVHCHEGTNVPQRRGRRKAPAAIRPYSCQECAAQFTILSNLKSHMKLHSGERCLECDFCGAGFTQRSNLKTHMQRMHGRGIGQGRRRIRCDDCPAMFRLKRCLKTHKKKRHPIKSLKIKLSKEQSYSESGGHSDDLTDEYASDDDCIHGDYSENEENNFDCKISEDFKRKTVGLEDKKTVYDRSPFIKVETDLESQFEYPGSPVSDITLKDIKQFAEENKLPNGTIDEKDNQKTAC